ncbi:MAG: amidohydrolase family protein [Rhodovarius sp.]|nr:amidohydrolase family protein [Rhodovarius sp.]MDW8313669.1 amidohydrolase family protein [Rhodovarius sp.]
MEPACLCCGLRFPHLRPRLHAAAEPSGRPRPRVIDPHAHFFPQEFLDLLASPDGRAEGADVLTEPEGMTIIAGGMRNGPLSRRFVDPALRVADMDAAGVDVQVLSLTAPMLYWASPAFGERLARAYNDAASAAAQAWPGRLYGFIALPLQDTDRALREFDRARRLPGMRGVYMGTHIAGTDLSAPRLRPVFEAIEAAGLNLFLHPCQTLGGPRLAPYYLGNLLGNPFESAVAAAHLIFGGVLDACPKLEVHLVHGGGALPILFGRLDHGHRVRAEARHLPRPPSEYRRRFAYDTLTHSAEILRWVVSFVGADRVTIGSDYCFDMGVDRPAAIVDELGLGEAERAAILGGNAARLLGL